MKTRTKNYSFRELYSDISKFYINLEIPIECELNKLDEINIRVRREKDTLMYIISTITAALFFLSMPVFVFWSYEEINSLEPSLALLLNQSIYLKTHQGIFAGLSLFALAAIFYSLIIHTNFFGEILNKLQVEPLGLEVGKSDKRFLLYQSSMIYAAAAVLIVLIYSYISELRAYTMIAAYIWLLMPAIILSMMPATLFGILMLVCLTRRNLDNEAAFASLLREILLLLQLLKDVSYASQLSNTERMMTVNHIKKAANLFRLLYLNKSQNNKLDLWAKARMNRVADNFLALGAWIFFPKADSIKSLKECLVTYSNIVLAGSFDDLNSKEIDASYPFLYISNKRNYFKRLFGLIWLLTIATLPLMIYAGITILTNLTIPTSLQTPVAISYSAWVAACLFAHIEELAPEAKTTLMDLLKLIRFSKE